MDEPPIEYVPLASGDPNWENTQRPRQWHRTGKLVLAVFWNVLMWISFVWLIWGGILWWRLREPGLARQTLAALIVFSASVLASFIAGTSLKCPLCHGTPLLGKPCRKHRLAHRMPLLGRRAAVVLHIIFRGVFRCMYCGTPYRLRK